MRKYNIVKSLLNYLAYFFVTLGMIIAVVLACGIFIGIPYFLYKVLCLTTSLSPDHASGVAILSYVVLIICSIRAYICLKDNISLKEAVFGNKEEGCLRNK